jgi:transcriptional regulator with XRE-family HTH domain
MPRLARKTPAELTPGAWPTKPSQDPVAEVARQLVLNLREAVGERSIRAVGVQTGLDHSTILRILGGEVWPDLETIAKIELGLGVSIYPQAHGE